MGKLLESLHVPCFSNRSYSPTTSHAHSMPPYVYVVVETHSSNELGNLWSIRKVVADLQVFIGRKWGEREGEIWGVKTMEYRSGHSLKTWLKWRSNIYRYQCMIVFLNLPVRPSTLSPLLCNRERMIDTRNSATVGTIWCTKNV